MTCATLRQIAIRGIATAVPETMVANSDGTPMRERLIRNIGIAHRRQLRAESTFSDLCVPAFDKLMSELGWVPSDIDVLLVVTQSPDYLIPSTAIILQDRLGIGTHALAYDINLGCSGYPYGLFTLGSLLHAIKSKTNHFPKGVLLVGDKSTNPNSKDNGLLSLFSDAASCTALEYSYAAAPMYFHFGSDGAGHKAIHIPAGGQRNPIQAEHLERKAIYGDDIARKGTDVILDGPAILSFSTKTIPDAVHQLLTFAETDVRDVDHFVFHQANKLINDEIKRKLSLDDLPQRVLSSLWDFGNTSSASIPLTITTKIALKDDSLLLLSGFGVGLSWASCLWRTGIITPILPPLVQVDL